MEKEGNLKPKLSKIVPHQTYFGCSIFHDYPSARNFGHKYVYFEGAEGVGRIS